MPHFERTPGEHELDYLSEELESAEEDDAAEEDSEEIFHTDSEAEDTSNENSSEPELNAGTHSHDANTRADPLGADEEEFHTESEDPDDEQEGASPDRPAPPLLPAHLLNPLPSPASPALHNTAAFKVLPWDQLTPGQKRNARRRLREAAKKRYDRLKRESEGTGVIEAGRFAQARRGVFVPTSTRKKPVVHGRVEKRKIETSGRQKLLAQRSKMIKAAAEQSGPVKKKRKTEKVQKT